MSSALLSGINRRLAETLPVSGHYYLDEAVSCALLAPGKRLRPLMMLALAEDLSLRSPAVLDLSCSIEMLHCASLILDDLPCMDNAQLRRGQPTTHIRFGESTAVLAAFSLLNQAHFLVSRINISPCAQRDSLSRLYRDTVTQLISGQQFDLDNSMENQLAFDGQCDMTRLNYLKTGSLFVACAESVGLLADLDQADLENLRQFAGQFGIAYQLLDDLNDHSGNVTTLGKNIGQDKAKSTVLNRYGFHQSRALMERHLCKAQDHLKAIQPNWEKAGEYLGQFSGLLHA